MLLQSVSWLEKSLFSPNSNKNLEVLILVLIYRILFNDFLPKKKEWGCTQILEKLNSIESKMSSFNESIKKTEDKLERVILNQQTFSTKLETIEKNSVSKLNLTPVIYLFCKFFISNWNFSYFYEYRI